MTLCQELHLDLSNLPPQQTVSVCYIYFDSWKQGFLDFALVSNLVTVQLLAEMIVMMVTTTKIKAMYAFEDY